MKLLILLLLISTSALANEDESNHCRVEATKLRFFQRCTMQMVTYFAKRRIQIADEVVEAQCGCAAKNFPVEDGANDESCDFPNAEGTLEFMNASIVKLKCRM